MRIHHATANKASKFHIRLEVEDNEVTAYAKDGTRLASGLQANKVLEEAITKQTGHPAKKSTAKKAVEKLNFKPVKRKARRADPDEVEDDFEEDDGENEGADEAEEIEAADAEAQDEDSDADQRRSGVKQKYKTKYKPFGGRCGDDLSEQITEHVTDGDGKTDKAALMRFAKANDAWKPAYGTMTTRGGVWNAGMARMNVSNILRARLRRAEKDGKKYEINWA